MKPHLTAIVAMDPLRIIGRDLALPWNEPADLAFFRRTTTGHTVVMGRKTFSAIGRPLPNRRNIVVTRDPHWAAEGVEIIHAPAELEMLPNLTGRVFIIGGAEIYTAFLPDLTDLIVTHIFKEYPGDTRFPEFEQLFPHTEILETHPNFEVRHWHR